MASDAQRKYDDHYELNFEVLQPPPKIVSPDSEQGSFSQSISPAPEQKTVVPHPFDKQSAPKIQITQSDEFASEEIRTKLNPHQAIPPRQKSEQREIDEKIAAPVSPTPVTPVSHDSAVVSPQKSAPENKPAAKIPEESKQSTPHSTQIPTSQPRTPSSMATSSSYTPPSSNYTRNVERQSKEQKSMNTILSGVGLFLLVLVLIFAVSAGFGGYVLWKEIQNQQVTVGRLDAKYAAAISGLDENIVRTNEEIANLQLTLKTQRDEIVTLRTQQTALLTQLRNSQRDIESSKARVQELERAMGIRNRAAATTPR